MIKKIKQTTNLVRNMGLRYLLFRTGYILRKKTRLLQKRFPVKPPDTNFIELRDWKNLPQRFFFNLRQNLAVPIDANSLLKEQAENILHGKFLFFSNICYALGNDYDWLTNPDTGYKYDIEKHWVDINDYSKETGDIKFVWEKSRFSYLFTLLRYDFHFQRDLSEFVFSEIESWINANPINMGPNYKCSQEISLRMLNWTYALHYYKESKVLTQHLFSKIINSIYWQTKHVYGNINFSRIAVRNNHAITETLALYLFGLLYPFFPEASKWREDGKRWFEKEIEYQIYPDGTFLQFSMNYHRVVIQLLTWALSLAKVNNESFTKVVYDRASASLHFLLTCLNEKDGNLPNYGANDGALFFPLNNNDFRDYRPQLEALSILLDKDFALGSFEDKYWYGLHSAASTGIKPNLNAATSEFKDGGYYILREKDSMTFIRCGNYKDRPSQADNLHIDIWANGENILRDAGSYKYNTDEETIRYFFGTASHNTVMLDGYDQMLKGQRFIWYYWSGPAKGEWKEEQTYFEFTGKLHAFKHVAKDTVHTRIVRKYKNKLKWEIIDEVTSSIDLPITQIWNPYKKFDSLFTICAVNRIGQPLETVMKDGWYSGQYGKKEASQQILYKSQDRYIHTTIEAKSNLH